MTLIIVLGLVPRLVFLSALGMLPPGEIERRERLRASATVFNEDPVYAVRYLLTEKLHVIARGRPALARYSFVLDEFHHCAGILFVKQAIVIWRQCDCAMR